MPLGKRDSFGSIQENSLAADIAFFNDNYHEAVRLYGVQKQLQDNDPTCTQTKRLRTDFWIGSCLYQLGQYQEAAAVLVAVGEQRENLSTQPDSELLRTQLLLALVYQKIGENVEATTLLKEVLKKSLINLGPEHSETLRAEVELAYAQWYSKRPDECFKVCKKAEAICDAKNEFVTYSLIARINCYRAMCLRDMGRLEEAWEIFSGLQESMRTGNRDEVARVQLGSASCLFLQGKVKESIICQEAACNYLESRLGSKHTEVLCSKLELASYLSFNNDYEEAVKLCLAVEKIAMEQQEDNSDLKVRARVQISICNSKAGSTKEAYKLIPEYSKAELLIFSETGLVFGEALLSVGLYTKAYEVFQRRYREFSTWGPDHRCTLYDRRQVGWSMHLQTRYAAALDVLSDVEQTLSSKLDSNHLELQLTRYQLAACLQALGMHQDALKLFDQVYPWYEAAVGHFHPFVFRIRAHIGICLAGTGVQSISLKVCAKEVGELLVAGKVHPTHFVEAAFDIANSFFQARDYTMALDLYKKVELAREESLWNGHPDLKLSREKLAECEKALLSSVPTAKSEISPISSQLDHSDELIMIDNAKFWYHSEMEKTLATLKFIPEEDLLRKHKSSVAAVIARVKEQHDWDKVRKERITLKLQSVLELHKTLNEKKKTCNGAILGLDLGTSYCCAAVFNNQNELDVIYNNFDQLTTPSYVCLEEEDNVVVGEVARNMAHDYPDKTIFHAKRILGKKLGDPHVRKYKDYWQFTIEEDEAKRGIVIKVGDASYKPEEILRHLVEYMKLAAEDATGEDVINAVVAIPAHFNEHQSYLTKQACYSAGLNILKCITEPAAAALASSINMKAGTTNSLIFDLGGGTFDVAVVEARSSHVNVLAIDGDPNLGGEDFDNAMVEYCIQEFKKEHGICIRGCGERVAEKIRKIKNQCEYQKRFLCSTHKVIVGIDCILQGLNLFVPFDRDTFNGLIQPYLETCMTIVDKVLTKAGVEIDEIVMVGGSSRILRVQEMLKEKFPGKKLIKSTNPDHAVAMGAAVFGQKLKEAEDLVQGMSQLVV